MKTQFDAASELQIRGGIKYPLLSGALRLMNGDYTHFYELTEVISILSSDSPFWTSQLFTAVNDVKRTYSGMGLF